MEKLTPQKVQEVLRQRGTGDIEVATGINNGDISRIENGKTNIEFITIAKLSEALDVKMFELFHFEPSISKKEKGNVQANRTIKKKK
jgi:transcriptional regulator with XRE-family HTH domain